MGKPCASKDKGALSILSLELWMLEQLMGSWTVDILNLEITIIWIGDYQDRVGNVTNMEESILGRTS